MAQTQRQNLYIPKVSHQNIPMKIYVHLQQAKNGAFIAEKMPTRNLWHHIVLGYVITTPFNGILHNKDCLQINIVSFNNSFWFKSQNPGSYEN